MDRKKALINQLSKFRKKVSKKIPLDRLILFGSHVTGMARKYSDVDLIIVSSGFRKLNFFRRGAMMYDFWNLDYPVDFLCYTPEEFNRLRKQISIVKQALEEGIEIN